MKKILAVYLLTVFFISCTKDTASHNHVGQGSENEFVLFYNQFLSDSIFQFNHIQFPLAGMPSIPESENTDFKWKKEDWVMHKVFDPAKSGFYSRFTHISDELIIEQIVHNQTHYAMERRFSKLSDGEWYLIYYAALSPLNSAD